jgi:hypothetical protein
MDDLQFLLKNKRVTANKEMDSGLRLGWSSLWPQQVND